MERKQRRDKKKCNNVHIEMNFCLFVRIIVVYLIISFEDASDN